MSPPPPLPLDHLIISNNQDRGLLLGLALRTSTPTLDLSLSPSSSAHNHILTSTAYEPSLTLSLLFPNTRGKKQLDEQSSRDNEELSSFSNSVSVKREREEEDAAANNINDAYEDVSNTGLGGGSRKKLRLNKEQSALLESSFKLQSTLNPKQKEALARQLNLRPRQVEVWFQNRRARTKLKQTEVDCEFLKKCCERLSEENEQLHKELQELKQVAHAQPFYMKLPPTRLTICPSCERLTDLHKMPAKNNHAKFLASSKKRMIFNPFNNPSTAC